MQQEWSKLKNNGREGKISSTLFVCDWGMQIKLTKARLTEEMVYSISPKELHRKEVNIPPPPPPGKMLGLRAYLPF